MVWLSGTASAATIVRIWTASGAGEFDDDLAAARHPT